MEMANSAEGTTGFQKTAIAFLAIGVVGMFGLGVNDLLSGKGGDQEVASAPYIPVDKSLHEPGTEPVKMSAANTALLAKPSRIHTVGSTGKLWELFESAGYKLERVRERARVPRLLIAALPKDIVDVTRPAHRKATFIKSMLPIVLHVNERVLRQRTRIIELRTAAAAGTPLAPEDEGWLHWISDYYGLKKFDFEALLERVDIVPPALAIAQGAEESGWGTSRFAREGNAIFGQRAYRPGRAGIVPKKRPDGETFKVRAFNDLVEGVAAYVHNLNSHFAYDRFRDARAAMRAAEETVDGKRLITTLDRYSERGQDYIDTIKSIMRVNRLDVFDRARLRELAPSTASAPDA